MSITTKTPLAMFLRKGTLESPHLFITETNRMISDGGILLLREFPTNNPGYTVDQFGDPVVDPTALLVTLSINEQDVIFTEEKDPSVVLGEGTFRVDYEFGLLFFDPELYGTSIVKSISYVGRGAYYIAASRVYDDATYTNDFSQGGLFKTLQDVLNDVGAISVNSTITGEPGTEAAVTVDGTSFNFVIPRGKPFIISAEYASVADLSSETPNVIPNNYIPELFDLVIINTGSVEDDENSQLYIYDGEGPEGGFTFISDLSGATGPARAIQWKSEETGDPLDNFIIRWANFDNTAWDTGSEKNLSLTPSWNGTELTITRNEDSVQESYDLGITASWDDTTLILTPNEGGSEVSQDLGLTPIWDGSELIITKNLDNSEVSYDVGITPEWSGNGTLTITPKDGIGEPVSYDLGWNARFEGTVLNFEPDDESMAIYADLGVTPSWQDTTLTITPNESETGVSMDLGITPSWDDSVLTLTPNYPQAEAVSQDLGLAVRFEEDELFIESKILDEFNNPIFTESAKLGLNYNWNDTVLEISDKLGGPVLGQELGVYPEFGDGVTQNLTEVRFIKPDGTVTDYQELGVYASWNNTELTLTNPDNQTVSQQLALDFDWDGTSLGVKNPTEENYDYTDLGITASWNNSELVLTPNLEGSSPISQDLGLSVSFNDDELIIASKILNQSNEPVFSESVELGLNYSWDGTELTIQNKIGGDPITQELGTSAEWGDGESETFTSVRFKNGDGTFTDYQELGVYAEWNGTELTVITPEMSLDPVDLKADSPTITASANSVLFNEPAAVVVTEPTPNIFNLSFDIPRGEPLTINATYESINDLNGNINPTPSNYTPGLFDLAVIQSPEGAANEDNAKLYICDDIVNEEPVWVFISDLSGAKGDRGEKGEQGDPGPMPAYEWVGTAIRFELPEGGFGDLVDLKGDKGDNADDADINNTSTFEGLDGFNNQKEINEYFEGNFDSKLDITGGTITGVLTLEDSNNDILFTTANDGVEVTGPFSIKTGLFSVQDTNDNFLIDIADGFTSFYGDVQFVANTGTLLATNYAQETISYKDAELANINSYVAGVKDTRNNSDLKFWTGTQAQYNAISTKNADTLYFITDN